MNLSVALTSLLLVLPVELPDKTLLATLVLTTRYRPLPVLLGVSAAFAVQCAIAVTAGQLLTLLPDRVVAGIVAVLFAAGAFVLLRGGAHEESDEMVADRRSRGTLSIAAVSFGVLFAAEWGDASQLATAALTARYEDPVSVFAGSFVALVTVAALATVLGGFITRKVPLRLIQRIGGLLFVVFALVALWETVHPA